VTEHPRPQLEPGVEVPQALAGPEQATHPQVGEQLPLHCVCPPQALHEFPRPGGFGGAVVTEHPNAQSVPEFVSPQALAGPEQATHPQVGEQLPLH
jgi:hypothetical protein